MNLTRGTWPARRHLKSPDAAMRCDASTVCEPNCTRAATSTDLRQQIPSTKNATARTSLGRRPLRDYAGPAVTNLLALVRQQIAKLRGPVGPDGPIDIYGPSMICRRVPQDAAALPATPELSRTILNGIGSRPSPCGTRLDRVAVRTGWRASRSRCECNPTDNQQARLTLS